MRMIDSTYNVESQPPTVRKPFHFNTLSQLQ